MIKKPTVLVLGAGASHPYGFPTGSKLARDVVDALRSGDFFLTLSQRYPVDQDDVAAFLEAFPQSGCETLDEFVESSGNRRFLPLVKASIVEKLIACERDELLLGIAPAVIDPKWPDEDWLPYLFREMRRGVSADQFAAQNNIRVITFNFDRSFERRLFMMLQHAYGVSPDAAGRLRGSVPVLHLHGSLGGEKWLNENRPDSREYVSTATVEQAQSIAMRIRLIHDEIDTGELRTALDWLREAHTICFLGFGYHHINLRRLEMRNAYLAMSICGTAAGFTIMEIEGIKREFHSIDRANLDTGDRHILRYLREIAPLPTDRKGL